jgi:hypothetical protein
MKYLDINRIKRVLMLEKGVFKEIRDDKNAMGQAIATLLLAGIIGSILNIILSLGLVLIFVLIISPIAWVIISGMEYIVAKLLGGKAKFDEHLKITGYSMAPMALGFIPVIGSLIGGIWNLVCTVIGLQEAHEISLPKAVVAVLLPALIIAGIAVLVITYFASTMLLNMPKLN